MNKHIKELLKDLSPLEWITAKLWDNKQWTRKYKRKLPRKRMWTWVEKQREYLKYKHRIGQFKKRGT